MAWRFDGRTGLLYSKIYWEMTVCNNVTRGGLLKEMFPAQRRFIADFVCLACRHLAGRERLLIGLDVGRGRGSTFSRWDFGTKCPGVQESVWH